MPEREHLSDVEVALLDELWQEHGAKDQWQLVDWCHAHCKEWTPLANGCAPIAVKQMARCPARPRPKSNGSGRRRPN